MANKEINEIADRLDNLASCIAKSKVDMWTLRNSISDIRYAIAKLREVAANE